MYIYLYSSFNNQYFFNQGEVIKDDINLLM